MSNFKDVLVANLKRYKAAFGAWALRNELISTVILVTILGLAIGGICSLLDFFLVA